jgi:hypothetical protein
MNRWQRSNQLLTTGPGNAWGHKTPLEVASAFVALRPSMWDFSKINNINIFRSIVDSKGYNDFVLRL